VSSPLQPLTSIKVKLGLLVTASALVAALVGALASSAGVPMLLAIPVTVALALAVTQLLAVGMTSPLREMTEATRRMARGDYRGRVRADSSDEIGELARAFNQMAAELATVDREQRNLVATVSHELRTPLAALTATLENLADGVRPADSEHLGRAVDQAQRIGALVGDLLELSRVEAGVAPLRLGPVWVGALVDEVVADLVPTGRAVRFDVDVPESLEVQADPTRLRQLLTNVLDNAVRHSPEGGRVRVTCEVTPVRWQLDVADEGPGVAPADRERAFERFGTLADPAEGAATGGTGLGLAIARWVATLHGGAISFADPPAGTSGALLRVDLPVSPPARPSAPIDQETPVPTTPSTPTPPTPPGPPATPPPIYPGHPGSTIVPAPVLDPLFGRFWPDLPGGSRTVVVAAAAVGALAGLVLPNHSAGLALFLVIVAAGLTVAYAARNKRDPFTLTCLALAALCTLPVLLLDAPWIGVLCLLAGATTLIAGVVRVHRIPEFVLAGLAWPLAGIRDLPWLGRSLRDLTGQARAPRVLVTAFWSVLAVLVFGLLFVSADAVVESWVDAVLPDISVDSVVLRVFIAVAVAGPTLAAAYLALNPPRTDAYGVLRRAAVGHRFEWLVPVLLVDAVFAVFVAAQLSVFFGGHDYVQRTTGLTYADYVHQGFGQLTVATLLTLLVVWAASHWAGDTLGDRVWLRASLGVLCALTLVVVGSALYRMHLYQEAYGFTQLRLLVDVFEGWLGVVVLAVAVAGLVRWGVWLPRFALVSGVVALLGVAAINPDAWIAERNLDRYADTGRVDWHFLRNLSADAVPVFDGRAATEVLCGMPRYWSQDDDWLSWNLGRSRASDAVDDGPDAMAAALATAQPTADDLTAEDCPESRPTP
jgi:two-component system, OmpR family, sensor histidine kinase BaeS